MHYAEAVALAAAAGGALEPMPDGIRHRHMMSAPLFTMHPVHGEIYFSSLLNRHASWLDDHNHFGTLLYTERPYHCTWADGSEISDSELAELRALHDESTVPIQ